MSESRLCRGEPQALSPEERADARGRVARCLAVTLNAGAYELFCNLPGHYSQGMHTGFTVA